jgi:hypothetical protein
MRGIIIREELTDEWKKRGAQEDKDYEVLTALGERSTTEIHRNEDSKGIKKLKCDAQAGGNIAGGARKQLEKKLGRPIVSRGNYLSKSENKKIR